MTSDTKDKLRKMALMLGYPAEYFLEAIEELEMTNVANRGPRAGSFNAQVIELNPGESVSKVRALDPTTSVSRLVDELPSVRQQVRNACSPAVARAKEMTGNTYSVEVGDCVMPNGTFFVVAVVTRTNS